MMDVEREEAVRSADLAQSDPALPEPLSGHGHLGNDQPPFAPASLAQPGDEREPCGPPDSNLPGDLGLLGAGESLASLASTGPARLEPADSPPAYPGRSRLRIFATLLAGLIIFSLLYAGLDRVSHGQTELLGQAAPPPLTIHRLRRTITIQVYDRRFRLMLPRAGATAFASAERFVAAGLIWLRSRLAIPAR